MNNYYTADEMKLRKQIRRDNKPKVKCRHNECVDLIEYRKNYPFGRKSKPRLTFKRVYAVRCKRCGDVFKK